MRSSISYSRLPTEQNNAASRRIDRVSIQKALQIIHREDTIAVRAVQKALPQIERGVKLIVASIKKGGRLFFIGAGTSGRLGILEAAECPPTFNTPPALIQAFMAGGKSSVFRSKEGAEDRGQDARKIIQKVVHAGDVVVGIAASGVTAFVREGLQTAKTKRASTVLVTCHSGVSKSAAQVVIALKTGPEVISGSTRLKAGTATKLVLNSLTVASMVQLGKVYGNRMVDLQPRSRKLVARGTNLIATLGRVSQKDAARLFMAAGGHAKTAIVMARRKMGRNEALRLLKKADGHLYKVIGRD